MVSAWTTWTTASSDLLRQNARAGYGDIGEKVRLSASAVRRQLDRLVTDGIIRAFSPSQVDPAVDGSDRGLRRAVPAGARSPGGRSASCPACPRWSTRRP
ncbi:MAG: winged helix-turn-helix transcriptional regulator [Schumannella sp.]